MDMPTSTEPDPSPSLQDEDALYRKFDDYPWTKDRQFLQGLAATLGPTAPSASPSRAAAISVQARIWWSATHLRLPGLSQPGYEAYLARRPAARARAPDPAVLARIEDVQRRLGLASDVPAWQASAPRADLARKAEDEDEEGGERPERGPPHARPAPAEAPYPDQFRVLVEAVTLGRAVPGVREIPDTVVRLPGISPVGKMQAPRKPWQKSTGASGETPARLSGPAEPGALSDSVLDLEFPPVGGLETADGTNAEGEGGREARTAGP